MTYCIGVLLKDGLVLAADSRTNAGVDHISTFRKMAVWETPGERFIALLTAGNLAVTQGVVNLLNEGLDDGEGHRGETLHSVRSMFRAAQLVGEAIREVRRTDGEAMKELGTEFSATMILGGQIAGRELRLFQIYAAGNFIEATTDTPFFQIGETKYGKPILDRMVSFDSGLDEAAKIALISMDSTLRSNISVGLPIDVLIYKRDSLEITKQLSIDEEDGYFRDLRKRWSRALRKAVEEIPDPEW